MPTVTGVEKCRDPDSVCKVCRKPTSTFLGFCDECWKERRKHDYVIEVNPPVRDDCKYLLDYGKNFGNYSGGGLHVETKEGLLDAIKNIVDEWESYDSILGRMPDKVTDKNLWFWSFTDEVTKADALGNKKLTDY